jgi:DNA-binding NarL/FixJ family response regulator
MDIKVLIADDQKIIREGIRCLLNNEPGVEVIGEAEDGRALVQLVKELGPDVVITETVLPNLNGIEATRQITKEYPAIKVIALTGYSDRRPVTEMLKAGAVGYVTKQCQFSELVHAIRNVVADQMYLCAQINGIVVNEYLHKHPEQDESVFTVLTSREREVLQLIAEGKSTKGISKELFVSVKTVDWHRRQLMKKLQVDSVAELVKYAINEGLTSCTI